MGGTPFAFWEQANVLKECWRWQHFKEQVCFCPRNVDGQSELEERWYWQRLGEKGSHGGKLAGVQAEVWGRQKRS